MNSLLQLAVDLIARSGSAMIAHHDGGARMRHLEPDVVIVGAGIAGGALGTVLARAGFEVVLLERENSYPDRVRGEFIAPWGVTELAKLELLQPLREAGALFTRRNIPYDENFAPAEAEARALDLTKMHAEGLGGLCLGHPATCDIFAQLATAAGATLLRGAGDISVTSGSRPHRQLRAQRREPRIPATACDRR